MLPISKTHRLLIEHYDPADANHQDRQIMDTRSAAADTNLSPDPQKASIHWLL